jgi:hypothetical protein
VHTEVIQVEMKRRRALQDDINERSTARNKKVGLDAIVYDTCAFAVLADLAHLL